MQENNQYGSPYLNSNNNDAPNYNSVNSYPQPYPTNPQNNQASFGQNPYYNSAST